MQGTAEDGRATVHALEAHATSFLLEDLLYGLGGFFG
jgi:hypothetical protein